MMMSVNYDFYFFELRWEINFGNVGSSHGLWVASFYPCLGSSDHRVFGVFQCEQTSASVAEIMGGKEETG